VGDLNDHHNKKAWEKIMDSQFYQFHTKIVKNTHGNSGGVRGAAWL